MRIAILGTRGIPANYGGFETCAEQLSRRWVAWGHDVVVYARRHRYEHRPAILDGVQVQYTRCLHRFGLETPSATALAVIHLLCRKRGFRWIHLYNTGNAFLLPLLRACGFRVVISIDGIEWRRKKWGPIQRWSHRLGAHLAVRFADRVVADNKAVADFYAEQYRCSTATIAYGAQPIERADDAPEILSRFGLHANGYCIFVGRIVPEKGVRELIDAYERIDTKLSLVIVGDDAPTAYRNNMWARRSDTVRFLGYQYGRVYEQLLANARMYVSASMLEGTSPSLLSAMSAGVCCLVNGIPENRSTAEGSVAFYEENDSVDLVRCWQALLDDPDRLARIAAAGQAHQRRYYDWDVIANQYVELFKDIERQRVSAPETVT
jgi:glycosyltransferase involved in cell wall biosynthesis